MVSKGRQAKGVDLHHPHRVLNNEKVIEIRKLKMEGLGSRRISRIMNCTPTTILNVLTGKTWRHV
jgi:hypothetical protein